MRFVARLLVLISLAFWPAAIGFAQTGAAIEVVDVNLSRYDELGQVTLLVGFRNFAEGLDPSLLQITANGQPVTNLDVDSVENTSEPVGIVLTIDVSGSMLGAPMEAAKAAAKSFVESKRAGDFIALVTFADGVQTLSSFTTDSAALISRIDGLVAAGETAFNDGVVQSLDLYQGQDPSLQRNIIVLSDGTDTVSQATFEDVLGALNAQPEPVRVFGVALASPDFTPDALQQLAEAGGGLFLSTTDPAQLAGLYGQVQREINNLLVVRFTSPISAAGPIDFSVGYGDLSAALTADVPGYLVPTTPPTTTATTWAPPSTFLVVSGLPATPTTLILLATVGIGAAIGLFIVILFGRGGEDAAAVFRKRLEAYGRRGAGTEEKKSFMERVPLLRLFSQRAEEEVRKRGLLSGVNSALEQANIPLTAGEAVTGALGLSGVVGLLAGIFYTSVIAGVVAAVVWAVLVLFSLNFAGGREKRRFEKQLPDTLTLIATSLRAGYSLLQAVEAVAAEAPNPTAREFGRAIAEARLGRPVVQALAGITNRTQSQDFEWVVMAVEIQREVGGNLAEVLHTVADTMMQRNRLRGEIRALTAEGRISAFVLGSLPFVMSLFLWTTNRTYLMTLFTETLGIVAVIAGGLLMLAGIIWLRRIVNIEV